MKQKLKLEVVRFMRSNLNSVCIICGKRKKGFEVEEDIFIKGIREIKKILGIEKKNKLVVCKECYPKYLEMRKKYETKRKHFLIIFLVYSLVVMFFSIVYSLSSRPISLSPILSAIFFLLFLLFLFLILLLPYYVPKVKEKKEKIKSKK